MIVECLATIKDIYSTSSNDLYEMWKVTPNCKSFHEEESEGISNHVSRQATGTEVTCVQTHTLCFLSSSGIAWWSPIHHKARLRLNSRWHRLRAQEARGWLVQGDSAVEWPHRPLPWKLCGELLRTAVPAQISWPGEGTQEATVPAEQSHQPERKAFLRHLSGTPDLR